MSDTHLPLNSLLKHPVRYALALFVIVGGLYFLTYDGHSVSGDEEILFDGVHSLAQHGNLWLSYMNDVRPVGTYPDNAPVPSVDSEPMQIIAALPLFWLAQTLPGIGLAQTVWLLNLLVTALTVVVMFYYALLLGYSARTAIIGALLFAIATMAWPYSKVFFREPLLTLFALTSAYCIQRWRLALAIGKFHVGWLIGAIVALSGALATKNSTLFFLPAFLLIAIPESWRRFKITKRQSLLGVGGLLIVIVILIIVTHYAAHGRYSIDNLISTLQREGSQIPYALAGYLFSPGRSLWAFNPILLLGFWGVLRLWRQKKWREIMAPLLVLVGVAVGYAVLQNTEWYGGTAWGPRYLLPTIPFMTLLILPVIDVLPGSSRWIQVVTGAIIAFSVGIQLLGTLIPLGTYYDFLGAETIRLGLSPGTINGWQAGTWDLHYIPLAVLPQFIFNSGTDLALLVNGTPTMAVLCLLLMGAALLYLRRSSVVTRPESTAIRRLWPSLGLVVGFIGMLGIGLYTYRTDPRFGGGDLTLHQGLDALNAQIKAGDAVLLNDHSNRLFFMNFYKSSIPIFTLPNAPGEVSIPGVPPEIVSNNLDALAPPILAMMLPRIALTTNRWWLVTEFIPADTRRNRITERYLTQHYFPIQEVFSANLLRVVGFSDTSAPPATIPPWPALIRNDLFGDTFTLIGADPVQLTVQRSQALPMSLLWRFNGWPPGKTPFDYSLNVSLVDSNGAIVAGAQRSGTPLGTFGITSQWQPGGYYRDNHALSIPTNLAAGTYYIWVVWYDWRDGSRLTVNGSDHDVVYTLQVQ
jgi:hypothetical protein